MEFRMRRNRLSAVRSRRRAECFVRGESKRDTARNDQRRRNFITHHGILTNSQVRELVSRRTLRRASRARQRIINY